MGTKASKAGPCEDQTAQTIPEDYRIKSVTIGQNRAGTIMPSVLFEYENQITKQPMPSISLDCFHAGTMRRDSEGREPEYPGYYRRNSKRTTKALEKCRKVPKTVESSGSSAARMHESSGPAQRFCVKQSRSADAYDGASV